MVVGVERVLRGVNTVEEEEVVVVLLAFWVIMDLMVALAAPVGLLMAVSVELEVMVVVLGQLVVPVIITVVAEVAAGEIIKTVVLARVVRLF